MLIAQNNQIKKQNFKGGLTPQILAKIKEANPAQISRNLKKAGISTSFKDCQLLAYLTQETVKLFQNLGLKLPPPNQNVRISKLG